MRRTILLLGIALVLGLAVLRLSDPEPVREIRFAYFDTLQRVSPRPLSDTPVRVVDIDEASLAAVGQWPWPRDLLADLVDRLREAGAAVIAFDVIFAEPDRLSPARLAADPQFQPFLRQGLDEHDLARLDHDVRFAEAIARAPVVLGVARIAGDQGNGAIPKADVLSFGSGLEDRVPAMSAATPILPILLEAASGLGSISVNPDAETTVVRQVPLIWRTENGLMPGLAVEALRVALGEGSVILWPETEDPSVLAGIGIGEFDVPTSDDGKIWVRYRREGPTLYVSAHQILDGTALDQVEGRIVLIGASAAGLLDLRATAIGEVVPGVSIHAQILEQILSGNYLRRTDFAQGLEFAMFFFSGMVVVAVMSLSGPLLSVLSGGVTAALIAWASWAAFSTRGLLIDATFPLVGGFAAFSLLSLFRLFVTDRDARLIRRSFSHYVAPEVLQQIEREGHHIGLGGTDREITVMFSDIRNYTALSESLEATDLVLLLNDLFSTLTAQIIAEHGTVDKFMGDSVMAFWNAPVEAPDHVERACKAALRMRAALSSFNAGAPGRNVQMGLGIATGMACVGNIGSRDQFNYTAVGHTVNVAARIEAICRHIDHDIAATDTAQLAVPGLAWLEGGAVALKGVSHRIGIHVLAGGSDVADSAAFADLSLHHRALCDAMRLGADPGFALEACKRRAAAQFPTLSDFYDTILARGGDFPADISQDVSGGIAKI